MARWRAWAAAMALVVALVSGLPAAASAAGIVGERTGPPDLFQAGDGRPDGRRNLTPNQLTAGQALSYAEALAACGPAAAVALARATGRTISLDAAVVVAREVGWTAERGMAGPSSQVALLKRLGIGARLEAGIDRRVIASEVSAGRPVIVRTWGDDRGHYLVAERYDASNGRFDFGQSALVLRLSAGRRWFALDEVSKLGVGSPTHTIYLAAAPATESGTGTTTRLSATSLGTSTPISAGRSVASGSTDGPSRVVDAGGSGARLRAEPSTAAGVVGLVADGTRLTDLGATESAGGRTWRRVADASGTKVWIAEELLRPLAAR